MATATWTEIVAHSTGAEFRTWGKNISDNLSGTSSLLTKTADTGQIDWATVTKPTTTNTDAGFEIYELTDSFQATSPVFIKIFYGNGGTTSRVRLKIQIGVETDGAGAFVGLTSGEQIIAPVFNLPGTSHTSYLSINEGFVAFIWQFGGLVTNQKAFASFVLSRTSDNDGSITGDGILVLADSRSSNLAIAVDVLSARTLTSKTIDFLGGFINGGSTGAGQRAFLAPSADDIATSFDGSAPQVLAGVVGIPEAFPISNLGVAINSEVTILDTVSVALAGTTARTYRNMGLEMGKVVRAANSNAEVKYGLCILWE